MGELRGLLHHELESWSRGGLTQRRVLIEREGGHKQRVLIEREGRHSHRQRGSADDG